MRHGAAPWGEVTRSEYRRAQSDGRGHPRDGLGTASGNCIKIQSPVGGSSDLVLASFAGDIGILQLLRATPGNKLGEVSPPQGGKRS
jgi:hypothetical protein